MLHLSRVLLFTVTLVATLYVVYTIDSPYAPFVITVLIVLTVLAFMRALSSEYDGDNPRPRQQYTSVHTEPTETYRTTATFKSPEYTKEDDPLDRTSGPRRS